MEIHQYLFVDEIEDFEIIRRLKLLKTNKWPRNNYSGPGGGLYTGPSGGAYNGPVDSYMSNIPPWPIFVKELEKRGYNKEVELIKKYHKF